jgi:hypothetical protein
MFRTKTVDSVITGLTGLVKDLKQVSRTHNVRASEQRTIVHNANIAVTLAVNESERATKIAEKIEDLIS